MRTIVSADCPREMKAGNERLSPRSFAVGGLHFEPLPIGLRLSHNSLLQRKRIKLKRDSVEKQSHSHYPNFNQRTKNPLARYRGRCIHIGFRRSIITTVINNIEIIKFTKLIN